MDLFSLEKFGSDAELRAELNRLAISLSVAEVRQVRDLLGRNPSLVELYVFNGEWSEHCSYKSSRPLLKKYLPTEGPTVIQGPAEDAGILHLTDLNGERIGLVIAHESHNHPSQVLPVEGAATGIGGVVRDVDCMGARVIGVADPLRFGDPNGRNKERTRWIVSGVVEGIMEYGNALGVPNLGGDVAFNDSFDDNCLVNVAAIGLLKESEIVHSRVPEEAATTPYDLILIGKSTDASGFGGAAFASVILDENEDTANRGAVQVHDPFLQNVLVMRKANETIFHRARERGLAIGFKDLGAAGIGCAAAEIAATGGFGARLNLDEVHQALPNLPPEVIALAETQERFILACPREFTPEVLNIYNEDWELPRIYPGAGASVIGEATVEKNYTIFHKGCTVADAPIEAVVEGIKAARTAKPKAAPASDPVFDMPDDLGSLLLKVLRDPNIASKEDIFRYYDTEVQGNAVLRPGEADATVIAPLEEEGSAVGVALTVDGNPFYGRLSPYWGAATAVAESLRNIIATGGKPLGLTDCLNYGNPENPEAFWQLEEGVKGLSDAARGLTLLDFPGSPTPFVSGNVSLYNESASGVAIDPSPIICCVGKLEDYSKAVTLRLKSPGNRLYLVGDRRKELGGSAYYRALGKGMGASVVTVDFKAEASWNRAVHRILEAGLAVACHDISEGGAVVALAEMVIGSAHLGNLGAEISLPQTNLRADEWLFSETGGYLLEVSVEKEIQFNESLSGDGIKPSFLGLVTEKGRFKVFLSEKSLVDLEAEAVSNAWRSGLKEALNA